MECTAATCLFAQEGRCRNQRIAKREVGWSVGVYVFLLTRFGRIVAGNRGGKGAMQPQSTHRHENIHMQPQGKAFEVFRTDCRGWGVRAAADIRPGSYIMEYVGEVRCRERIVSVFVCCWRFESVGDAVRMQMCCRPPRSSTRRRWRGGWRRPSSRGRRITTWWSCRGKPRMALCLRPLCHSLAMFQPYLTTLPLHASLKKKQNQGHGGRAGLRE